jgi:toxin-antitoxin system PIN domain toxin
LIAIDTNVLVHSHRTDSPWHAAATGAFATLTGMWAIPWPCAHEFLAIVTHPRIFDPPSPLDVAIEAVETWSQSPQFTFLGETDDYLATLKTALLGGRIRGPQVHDARIAALCLAHGVTELWTADRDFTRFPMLTTRNPLVPS